MGNAYYYLRTLGHSPFFPVDRLISNASVTGTITLKTPQTGARLAITNVTVGANAAGTIAFYFGGKHDNDTPIAMYHVASSSQVTPNIQCWESTATDSPLEAMVSTGLTNAWNVQVEGFELYDN